VFGVEIENGLLLPVFDPEVPWNPSIMFIDFTIALLPVVVLAWCNPEPGDKAG
jgi:hypothetical protein